MTQTPQLDLFSTPTEQPKPAAQLAYEAWPFPGLTWEAYQIKLASMEALCANLYRKKS